MTEGRSGRGRGFDFQILGCEALGSRFSGAVLRAVDADIAAGGPFADLTAPWADWSESEMIAAAAPLRLLGGLHYLVLAGRAPTLAALYPPSAPDPSALKRCLLKTAETHAAFLADFIKSPPQTNEVRRSLCLIGGFLTVARETGLPLRCLEIGASAGLNLNWDRYRYDVGDGRAWGDSGSPVLIDGEWDGPPPPFDAAARVVERRGCDRAPVDLADPDRALRLEAYVWPDQPDRLARLRGAIALARRFPPTLDAEDAGAWASRWATPREGVATVLFHSIVWSYLSGDTKAAVAEAIRLAGELARDDRPFAWLRMEPASDSPLPIEVRLTLWPGGDERRLADVHPHGAKVLWRGA